MANIEGSSPKVCEHDRMFSLAEIDRLILAFARGRGEKGVEFEEVQAFVDWCETARFSAALVDVILSGKAVVTDMSVDGPRVKGVK